MPGMLLKTGKKDTDPVFKEIADGEVEKTDILGK